MWLDCRAIVTRYGAPAAGRLRQGKHEALSLARGLPILKGLETES